LEKLRASYGSSPCCSRAVRPLPRDFYRVVKCQSGENMELELIQSKLISRSLEKPNWLIFWANPDSTLFEVCPVKLHYKHKVISSSTLRTHP